MRVCVEGNIGAGKSSCLEAVRKALPEVQVFKEPLDEWGDLLDAFYADATACALQFSLTVLLGFDVPFAQRTCVVERSPMTCRQVFTQLLLDDGTLSREAWDLFSAYHDVLGWTPDAIVYIDTPVNTCLERVRCRGRACEAKLDVVQLRRIEYKYDMMLRGCSVPVVRVDGTLPPEELHAAVINAVRPFLAAPS